MITCGERLFESLPALDEANDTRGGQFANLGIGVPRLAQHLGRVLTDEGRRARMERPFLVERERQGGSSPSSGSPTTSQIALNSRSFPPAIISSPSRVGKTWYGATIGKTVPCPRGTVPSAR